MGSLRLTIVLLAFALVLVFAGTIAQVKLGIHAAQVRFFQSFVVYADVGESLRLPVLPGGYLVGFALVLNIACAYVLRIGFKRGRIGLLLIHGGLLMLLLGQLSTDLFQVESNLRFKEGERSNYSVSGRHWELAIVDTTDSAFDQVTVIPDRLLAPGETLRPEGLPFTVQVHTYWRNSRRLGPMETPASAAPKATQGQGTRFQYDSEPNTTRMDRRDIPTAYVELEADGKSLGTWCATGWVDAADTFTHDGHSYALTLRPTRYYQPYYLKLIDFSHDRYLGTNIPKNFSSLVQIQNPETREDREVLIYMNHPLRYGGQTYYQSGYDENDPTVTILQVVKNPGWLTPYLACTIVSVGLLAQFFGHLGRWLRKKTKAS
ncbi:MAG: cytochrome c biogenesis protein ResB [Verrucomicrobiae bacterium]|nr:cytochrome c biogenesis protein ResB [Verrucomicrobiae bacterium]